MTRITPTDFSPEAVILGKGNYPSHPLPLDLLRSAERVVCCDGAAFAFVARGGRPWRIVGDCDSILSPSTPQEKQILETHRHLIRRFAEQDDNDQTKAVRYCQQHGISRLAIVGATGGREDHSLGNISLLADYMQMGIDVRLYTDHGVFIPARDSLSLRLSLPPGFTPADDRLATRRKSTQISIFNIDAHGFASEGLRYPLADFSRWWQGTLNEAISPEVTISAHGVFLVFVCYPEWSE